VKAEMMMKINFHVSCSDFHEFTSQGK